MIHVVPDSSICAKCGAGPILDKDWRAHLLACQGIDLPEHPRIFIDGVEVTPHRVTADASSHESTLPKIAPQLPKD